MKSFRWLLIILGSAGLIFLAACSKGQQKANSDSKTTLEQSSKSTSGQVIQPTTQTGEVRMSLNAAATPLKQGKNSLMLTVMDAKTDKPLAVKDIEAKTIMSEQEMEVMGMKGMGEGSAKTEVKPGSSPGMYAIETNLSYGGKWQLKVNLKDTQPPASAVFDLVVK